MPSYQALKAGKIRVELPPALSGYEVGEKPLDSDVNFRNFAGRGNYDWVGNFGWKDRNTGQAVKGNTSVEYEVQLEDRPGKKIVYWNGQTVVQVPDNQIGSATDGGRQYKTIKLKLGDPPVGWTR